MMEPTDGEQSMSNDAIRHTVEQISEELVLLDTSDLQDIIQIQGWFQDVHDWAEAEGEAWVAGTASEAVDLINRIVLQDVPDQQEALQELSNLAGTLQRVVVEGKEPPAAPAPVEAPAPVGEPTKPKAAPRTAAPAPAAPAGPEASTLEPETPQAPSAFADPSLLADFVTEAREHLDNADVCLLTIETTPQEADALNAVFRAFHTIKGAAGFLELYDIQALAHEAETILDKGRRGEVMLAGHVIDLIFESADILRQMVDALAKALEAGTVPAPQSGLKDLTGRLRIVALAAEGSEKKLGEILVEAGLATEEQITEALTQQAEALARGEQCRLGELLVRSKTATTKDVAEALRTQRAGKESAEEQRQQQQAVQVRDAIKVDAQRLDRLVDLIGELVIAETMVTQAPEMKTKDLEGMSARMTQLDKITRELQEISTSLRLISLRGTFQKMARLVRDLSRKSNKAIEFSMRGEDTELDKNVADLIADPLMHMLRNAVDHGIEPDGQTRRAAGKKETAHIELRAYHKGGAIHIEIEDDGRGLDRDAILRKATEKGLVRDGVTLSDREICNLIFQPGFSTAKQVTDVSGRGVGMDVVRRNMHSLRGNVEIKTTPGKGSVFTIRLPLTLAIIDGMVLRVSEERYIVPTGSIVMSIRPEEEDINTVTDRGEMLSLQGRLIPIFHLSQLLNIHADKREATEAIVVIVEDDNRKVGLVVDELLGQQQTVIKPLGPPLRGLAGISGGAIMPDGRVGLILDVSGILKLVDGGDTPAPMAERQVEEQELAAAGAA